MTCFPDRKKWNTRLYFKYLICMPIWLRLHKVYNVYVSIPVNYLLQAIDLKTAGSLLMK